MILHLLYESTVLRSSLWNFLYENYDCYFLYELTALNLLCEIFFIKMMTFPYYFFFVKMMTLFSSLSLFYITLWINSLEFFFVKSLYGNCDCRFFFALLCELMLLYFLFVKFSLRILWLFLCYELTLLNFLREIFFLSEFSFVKKCYFSMKDHSREFGSSTLFIITFT